MNTAAHPVYIRMENVWKQYPCRKPFPETLLHPFQKRYKPALKGASFFCNASELTAVMGLNGAGKTTLFRILSGILIPDRGAVLVDGADIRRCPSLIRKNVGFVPGDERGFYGRLTARENLDFFAGLYGIGGARCRRRTDELCALFGIQDIDSRFSDYSSGYKERFAIIKGLLHDPAILIIDELGRSLDYRMRERVLDLIRSRVVRELNKTVIIGSNKPEGLEICDRLVILDAGVVHAQGSLDDLGAGIGHGKGVRGIFEQYVDRKTGGFYQA